MESNKQERKNLLNDMPIDNRATSPNKMRDYGKPTSPVAMRMAATKATLPMSVSPLENGDKDTRFKYDKDGNQIGMQDTATGSYYTPTEEGFAASRAKAEKIGRAAREFPGKLFTREGGTARGYQTAGGEFLRPTNDREWNEMQAQYNKDKKIYDSEENRRSTRRGIILDYTGPKRKK